MLVSNGGLISASAPLSLYDTIFEDVFSGASIFVTNSVLTLARVKFIRCDSSANGGIVNLLSSGTPANPTEFSVTSGQVSFINCPHTPTSDHRTSAFYFAATGMGGTNMPLRISGGAGTASFVFTESALTPFYISQASERPIELSFNNIRVESPTSSLADEMYPPSVFLMEVHSLAADGVALWVSSRTVTTYSLPVLTFASYAQPQKQFNTSFSISNNLQASISTPHTSTFSIASSLNISLPDSTTIALLPDTNSRVHSALSVAKSSTPSSPIKVNFIANSLKVSSSSNNGAHSSYPLIRVGDDSILTVSAGTSLTLSDHTLDDSSLLGSTIPLGDGSLAGAAISVGPNARLTVQCDNLRVMRNAVPRSRGGAIYAHSSSTISLDVSNRVIIDSNSAAIGGGIYAPGASSIILSSTGSSFYFKNNSAQIGGALFCDPSSIGNFFAGGNSEFYDNTATNSSCLFGWSETSNAWSGVCTALNLPALGNLQGNVKSQHSTHYQASGCFEVDSLCAPCEGPPPTGAICIGGAWLVNASDLIDYLTNTPSAVISFPTIFTGGDINIPALQLQNVFKATSSAASKQNMLYSSTNCFETQNLGVNISSEDVGKISKGTKSAKLITSTCDTNPSLKLQSPGPNRKCQKLKASTKRSSGTLQVLFSIDNSRCNIWWIVLASVLGGIVLLTAIFLIVIFNCKKGRGFFQPFYKANT